jgi:hypothetical protein
MIVRTRTVSRVRLSLAKVSIIREGALCGVLDAVEIVLAIRIISRYDCSEILLTVAGCSSVSRAATCA